MADLAREAADLAREAETKHEIPPIEVTREHAWSLEHFLAGAIAQGTAHIRDANNGQPYGHPGDITLEEWRKILDEISTGFQQYHDSDAKGEEPDYEKLKHSLDLFSRWYCHLWD